MKPKKNLIFFDKETITIAELTLCDMRLPEFKGQCYYFNRLITKMPKCGGATNILKQVIEYVDSVKIPIISYVNAYGKMKHEDLVKFYKKFGFVESKEFKDKVLFYFPKK
jgi:hypothetical protein